MTAILGLLLWTVILYPVWSPRCRRMRRGEYLPPVSGNRLSPGELERIAQEREAALAEWGVGPEWEQDHPFPEIFEEER